jgi:hypothetical protein
MCLECTHFPHPPNELATIVMKSMQMQVEKSPIVTLYCLMDYSTCQNGIFKTN